MDNDATIRKRRIKEMTLELDTLSPFIFGKYNFENIQSFNGKVGSKQALTIK